MKFSNFYNKGTYVELKFSDESNQKIIDLCTELNVPNPTLPEDIHATIAYSKNKIEYETIDMHNVLISQKGKIETWKTKYGNTLVYVLDSSRLHNRWFYAMNQGATYDYDEYTPHITLSRDIGYVKIDDKYVVLSLYGSHENVETLDF